MIVTWLKVFRIILSLANSVAEIIRNNKLMDAGEAKHFAKDLALLQERLGISDQVAAEVEKLSDQQVDEELRT